VTNKRTYMPIAHRAYCTHQLLVQQFGEKIVAFWQEAQNVQEWQTLTKRKTQGQNVKNLIWPPFFKMAPISLRFSKQLWFDHVADISSIRTPLPCIGLVLATLITISAPSTNELLFTSGLPTWQVTWLSSCSGQRLSVFVSRYHWSISERCKSLISLTLNSLLHWLP